MSISSVTSEALQLKLRQLLPSQQGFGTDLTAQNTIVPIIDLTAAAEGSDVPEYLQRAWDFNTSYVSVTAADVDVITNTGFWQVDFTVSINFGLASNSAEIYIDDGTTENTIWKFSKPSAQGNTSAALLENRFIVFLDAGKTMRASVSTSGNPMEVWFRQVADVNGTLVQPVGFSPS